MNSISATKPNSYKINLDKSKCRNSADSSKYTNKSAFNFDDKLSISDDAVTCYKFLNRIESSAHIKGANISLFMAKYASEYERIKKEITSGVYGSDTKKYTDLLNNAFKSALNHVSELVPKVPSQTHHIKMSSSALSKCQKQYNTATTLLWSLRAENKATLKKIEYYKRKKNHRKVVSLTQLSNTYKHIINNIDSTAALIKSNVDDNFSEDSDNKSKDSVEQSFFINR